MSHKKLLAAVGILFFISASTIPMAPTFNQSQKKVLSLLLEIRKTEATLNRLLLEVMRSKSDAEQDTWAQWEEEKCIANTKAEKQGFQVAYDLQGKDLKVPEFLVELFKMSEGVKNRERLEALQKEYHAMPLHLRTMTETYNNQTNASLRHLSLSIELMELDTLLHMRDKYPDLFKKCCLVRLSRGLNMDNPANQQKILKLYERELSDI